jgi:hypothetical protein
MEPVVSIWNIFDVKSSEAVFDNDLMLTTKSRPTDSICFVHNLNPGNLTANMVKVCSG